ncbi:TRAP transporter substrate-binding protein [Marinobacterium sp. YM272]|uniref:TRAP transporter substrate-binding protein n=1 Tax=Marinobacterium sp. YM272 TaxID=3421654 RepID=UPI003D7FCE27
MKAVKMIAAGAVAATLAGNVLAENMQWKALGQPVATGLIQNQKEQPFFENFAERTGLPIDVDYKPVDTTGIKDTEELRMLKSGLFDIVSIRVSQNSRDEPALLGLDLVGLNTEYDKGAKVAEAYTPVLDAQLQSRFNTKLLGVWPFGPQILFCNAPVDSFADIKGLKVRVYDQSLANFVESVGATPVPISFPDVHQALSTGVIDCAITGPSSANSAGWPEVATHQVPLGMGIAMNGYGISLKAWNSLDAEQQQKLQAAFDELGAEIWSYSESLYDDALSCNTGGECKTGKPFDLVNVDPTANDMELVNEALINISLPAWAEICDASTSGCSDNWKSSVGPIIGLN